MADRGPGWERRPGDFACTRPAGSVPCGPFPRAVAPRVDPMTPPPAGDLRQALDELRRLVEAKYPDAEYATLVVHFGLELPDAVLPLFRPPADDRPAD